MEVEQVSDSSSDDMMSFWMQFFTDAGIPTSAARDYSVAFMHHRIQKHLLSELNKEYLKDMGITAMGDILAILKQAKASCSQPVVQPPTTYLASDSSSESPARQKSASAGQRSTPPACRKSAAVSSRRSTPASRMVDHYLASKHGAARLMSDTAANGSNMSPELAKHLSAASTPTSVFSRLGQSGVSQGPSVLDRLGFPGAKSTNFTVTVVQKTPSSASESSGLRSVLKRPATSTCHDSNDSDSSDTPLEYAGVLKRCASALPVSSTKPQLKKTKRSHSPGRAVKEHSDKKEKWLPCVPTAGIFGTGPKVPKLPVTKRVGPKPTSLKTSAEPSLRCHHSSTNLSAKERLGQKNTIKSTN